MGLEIKILGTTELNNLHSTNIHSFSCFYVTQKKKNNFVLSEK